MPRSATPHGLDGAANVAPGVTAPIPPLAPTQTITAPTTLDHTSFEEVIDSLELPLMEGTHVHPAVPGTHHTHAHISMRVGSVGSSSDAESDNASLPNLETGVLSFTSPPTPSLTHVDPFRVDFFFCILTQIRT